MVSPYEGDDCYMGVKLTAKQERYLADIDQYTKLHGIPPAEAELLAYFRTSPSSIHQMILTLEDKGLISRIPGKARSIKVLVQPAEMPDLNNGGTPTKSAAGRFPNIAAWVSDH